LVIVFFATPVMRTVARIEFPSTKDPITAARFSVLSLFILTIMPDRLRIVKQGNLRLCAKSLAPQLCLPI
jgi:hypothetical protein